MYVCPIPKFVGRGTVDIVSPPKKKWLNFIDSIKKKWLNFIDSIKH